jgi:hypothetical protein
MALSDLLRPENPALAANEETNSGELTSGKSALFCANMTTCARYPNEASTCEGQEREAIFI